MRLRPTIFFLKIVGKGGGGVEVSIFLFTSKFAYKDFLAFDVHGYLMNRTSFVHPYMGIFIKVFQ